MNKDQPSQQNNNSSLSRRDFLKRGVGASVAAMGAVGAAAILYDDDKKLIIAGADPKKQITLPSFAVARPESANRMAIAHGDELDVMLAKSLKSLGGIETYIKKGDVVLVKPNVAFASPPLIGATSDPALVAAVVELSIKAGAARVIVTDNPINQPVRCFEQTGIGPAAKNAGAELFIPTESAFKPLTVDGGQLIADWPFVYKPFEKATKVIGIAPVKDHSRAKASLSMKNWYGLLGGRRNQFHQDIHNIIKELAMMVTPTLVILDGRRVMMRNGPTGGSLADIAEGDSLIVATDQVAADAAGYKLLGRDPAELNYLAMATELKLGEKDYEKIPYVEFNA